MHNIDKTQLDNELLEIKNPIIRAITQTILKNAPDYFWDPSFGASSSGKYHLQIDGKVESLIDHTKRVFYMAQIITGNPIFKDSTFTPDEQDIVLSACLLHDSVKRGFDLNKLEHTKFLHPVYVRELAENVLPQELKDSPFYEPIMSCVESHSGPWCSKVNKETGEEEKLPIPKNFSQLITHLCDFISSRRGVYINLENKEP